MVWCVAKRQIIREVNAKDLPANINREDNLLKIFRAYSEYHNTILSVRKLGEGGESSVWEGDVPGVNLVIK